MVARQTTSVTRLSSSGACDTLAHRSMAQLLDQLGKPTPVVLTYLDKGLGASILKAGLRLWDRTSISPVAAIKITRHNLYRPTALIHEAGHQVAHLARWNDELAASLATGLTGTPAGQILDFLFRSGNVHDSQGARDFILACIQEVRSVLPGVRLEVRMDSAFFSDEIVRPLHQLGVEFTITVPFERFPQLKERIERRQIWWRINAEVAYFEPRELLHHLEALRAA